MRYDDPVSARLRFRFVDSLLLLIIMPRLTKWQSHLAEHMEEAFVDPASQYDVYVGINCKPSTPFAVQRETETGDPFEYAETRTVVKFTAIITSNPDKKNVGHISGYLVDRSAPPGRSNLAEDFDAECQELVDFMHAILDVSGTKLAPRLRKGPVWSGGCDGGTLALVVDCALMPEHRGRGVLQILLPRWQRVFKTYDVKYCIAAFLPWKSPSDFTFRESDVGHDTSGQVQAKLAESFKDLGFRRFGQSEYYGCAVADTSHPCWSPDTHVPVAAGFSFTPDVVTALQTEGVPEGIRQTADAYIDSVRAKLGALPQLDLMHQDYVAAIAVLVAQDGAAMMAPLPKTPMHAKYGVSNPPPPIQLVKDLLGKDMPRGLHPSAKQAIGVLRAELNEESEAERIRKFRAAFPERERDDDVDFE